MQKLRLISLPVMLMLLIGCMPNQDVEVNSNHSSELTLTKVPIEENGAEAVEKTPSLPTVTYQPSTEPTQTASTGRLLISSIPEGAEFNIVDHEISGNTPYSMTLAPGDYQVILSLEGYQTLEESISIIGGETYVFQGSLTPSPMIPGQYFPLFELGGIGDISELPFLAHIDWEPENNSLRYAIDKGVTLSEAKDWDWWVYDFQTSESTTLPSPGSLVNDETRESLGLCPLDDADWEGPTKCSYLTTLFESEENNLITYSPLLLEDFPFSEGELWIAEPDGEMSKKLADFSPAYAHWSSDGKWLVTGQSFTGLPGQVIHYLIKTDGTFIKDLKQITGIDSFYLNGLFPEFSPDGKNLLFAGSKVYESRNPEDYKLFSLNLNNLESELMTSKFGLFQWALNGEGIYVLDGAFTPFADYSTMRETNLYYVDITQKPPQEYLIANNIPYYPQSNYGTWNWAYSPLNHAIAYIGYQDNQEFGILQLEK